MIFPKKTDLKYLGEGAYGVVVEAKVFFCINTAFDIKDLTNVKTAYLQCQK